MNTSPLTYTYKTTGDCHIKADVSQPPDGITPSGTLVYIHGGCLMYGSRKNIHPAQLGFYLKAGYTVISIDYRLAPETKLPEIIKDIQDAFQWIVNPGSGMFTVDPDKIAVIGHSAGGYLALMAGFCVAPRPKAIVSFYGYGDIVGDWYSKPDPFYCQQPAVAKESIVRNERGPVISEPYEGRGMDFFYLYCRQHGLWPLEVGGHDPQKEPAFFAPYCPIQNISSDYPPTLLLHGDRDTDVPYQQSVLMDEALAQYRIPHSLVTMSGQGHGFDNNMGEPVVKGAFNKVLAFLARYLTNGLVTIA